MIEIVDWEKHYENNRTRELKCMQWVPMPNRQDGDGYTELVDHPNGAAHLGIWTALLQIASRCDPRGTLVRDDATGHDEASLARMSRLPVLVWKEALPRLLKIGWIRNYKIPQEGATIPHPAAMNGMEWNGMNGMNGKKRVAAEAASEDKILYHSVEQIFLSKNDGRFTDYPKEGAAIKGLVKKTKIRSSDSPAEFIQTMCEQFWKLICGDDKFWKGQPFLPSALNASGIWDRVMLVLRNKEKMTDPVAMAVAKGEII